MKLVIRLANASDIKEYTSLLQKTYESAYADDSLGLTKDLFSKKIFNTKDTQDYLKGNLVSNKNQRAWLAFRESKMVGSITAKLSEVYAEITGFYVAPEYQGYGIGKQLWKKAVGFTKGRTILVDLYVHNKKTLEMYRKWGFEIDKSRGESGYFYRHWAEWPANIKAKCVYMRMSPST